MKQLNIVDYFTNQQYFMWIGKVDFTCVRFEGNLITLVTQLAYTKEVVLQSFYEQQFIDQECSFFTYSPLPRILPLLLLPYVTWPSCLRSIRSCILSCALSNHCPSTKDFSWLWKIPARIDQGERFGPLITLGLITLILSLGTHFKGPLGKSNLLTLLNLTVWPLFIK